MAPTGPLLRATLVNVCVWKMCLPVFRYVMYMCRSIFKVAFYIGRNTYFFRVQVLVKNLWDSLSYLHIRFSSKPSLITTSNENGLLALIIILIGCFKALLRISLMFGRFYTFSNDSSTSSRLFFFFVLALHNSWNNVWTRIEYDVLINNSPSW